MEDYIYPASLVVVAAMALIFYRSKSNGLMLITILIGVYLVYSHETGFDTSTLKQNISESIDESVKDYDESHKMGLVQDEDSKE